MKLYHAHVYFKDQEIIEIKRLKALALNSPLQVWQLFEHCVGPHALPMLELHFDETGEEDAIRWLAENRGSLSVLIHEDTGDDFKDHEEARWLGTSLPIHYEFFEQVKLNPKIAVHPGI